MTIRFFLIFCIVVFISNTCKSQIFVQGRITDSIGSPIPSAIVSLIKKKSGLVLNFAITDIHGNYKIQNDTAVLADSLILYISNMGYYGMQVSISKETENIFVSLKSLIVQLPSVTVRNSNNLIRLEGDTLNYKVSAFSQPHDRVIGDVMKKLPGIQVDDNGKITYQGKAINRFYIDGDNLLDGKYNIASNNIPINIVDKIQVLENHQPIKNLRNRELSDNAAVNILLKPDARLKLSGGGELGVATPSFYESTTNLMMFKKKAKFINYYKFNNTGVDLSNELISHFVDGNDHIPSPLLFVGTTVPQLAKKRYLFNRAGLANINTLANLQPEIQLRINASYLYDTQLQSSHTNKTLFLQNDTIRYSEEQNNLLFTQAVNTRFTFTANKSSYYLSNIFVLDNRREVTTGTLTAIGNANIKQSLSSNITNISNEINYIKDFSSKKFKLQGYSFTNYISNPEKLSVLPGLYENILNDSVPFDGLIQNAHIPTFFTHSYFSVKIPGKFSKTFRWGVNYQRQYLNSTLQKRLLNGSIIGLVDSFVNQLYWSRLKIYAQVDYSYFTSKATFTLSVPITKFNISYAEKNRKKHIQSLPITPSFFIKLQSGKESNLTLGYAYTNEWQDIKSVYNGFVMQSYRNFMANEGFLPLQNRHSTRFSYEFRNTLSVFFLRASLSYTFNNINSITDNKFSNILQQSKNTLFENNTSSSHLNVALSKYIFNIKSTLSINLILQREGNNQLANNRLLQYRNQLIGLESAVTSKIGKSTTITYSGKFSSFANAPASQKNILDKNKLKVKSEQHSFNLNFLLKKDFYFRIENEYYRSKMSNSAGNNYLFVDAIITYKLNKPKADIEFLLTNIGGTEQYRIVSAVSNIISEFSYRIRPRMALLKVFFNL